MSPFFIPACLINMISGNLSIAYKYKGPNHACVTACSTGTHAIGDAMRIIAMGDADVMVAGGAESAVNVLSLAGFSRLRAVTTSFNDNPEKASRPWDKDRSGFVMGEGSGALVLEELEHAKARGAKIYAEVVGYGMSGDAYHITAPSGDGAYRAMKQAAAHAKEHGIELSDIGYINAHGTSTRMNDLCETRAIHSVFGEHASSLAVSSTKSMTGHLLGAAGAVEAILCGFALQDGFIPATINYRVPDPECDLDIVPNEGRIADIEYAMSNSLGFGGHNAALIFRKVE